MNARRDALQAELDALVAAPTAETREAAAKGKFTPEEEVRFAEITTELPAIDERLNTLMAAEDAKNKIAEARNRFGMGDGTDVHVTSNEKTYRKGGPNQYFADMAALGTMGASGAYYGAVQRLQRHATEVEMDARDNPNTRQAQALRQTEGRIMGDEAQVRTGLTTAVGAGGTFLPPAYLLDDFIAYPRQTRVLADLVRKMDLPRGPMSINIPKITAPTLVNSQTTQNTAITEQDLTDAYVTAPVNTLAGQQTISLQAIEQSAVPYDDIVFADLQMARELNVETQTVNGSGSSNQFTGLLNTSGVNAVTYTDASPTSSELWGFLGQAKAKVYDGIFRAADFILMTPDRFAWLESSVDSSGRPLVLPVTVGMLNALGSTTGSLVNGPTPVGMLLSLPVYVTAVIPTNLGGGTNQDEVIVGSAKDYFLWESPPVARALPQTLGNTLSVLLQVYEYAAFMPNRLPTATTIVSGTGLVTPVFV